MLFQHTTGANPMILYSVICFIFLKGDTNISECVMSKNWNQNHNDKTWERKTDMWQWIFIWPISDSVEEMDGITFTNENLK